MKIVQALSGEPIWLGFQFENLARAVTFDFSAWAMEYGEGVITLAYLPPGSAVPYPMALTVEGTTATWTLTNTVTQKAGKGWALWSYRRAADGLVVKTCKCGTEVSASPEASGAAPPEPEASWVEQVLQASATAQEAAQAAQESLDKLPYPDKVTGTWWRYNSATGQYEDSGAPYDGDNDTLDRLPSINGVELKAGLTFEDLGEETITNKELAEIVRQQYNIVFGGADNV